MNEPLTPETIRTLLSEKGLKQQDLIPILSLTKSNVSNLMTGVRKISESEQKLLRLYFYGEIPFGKVDGEHDFSEVLSFTAAEADAIRYHANRVGISPEQWITEQIRTIAPPSTAK